jgi:hypothetical protein
MINPIRSFDDLENALRLWRSFKDQEIYDLNGMMAIVAACLDNLRENMTETDFDEVGDCLTEVQRMFLGKFSSAILRNSTA